MTRSHTASIRPRNAFHKAWLTRLPIVTIALSGVSSGAQPTEISFNHDIRPILSHNCMACHGPDEHDRQAGLRLDDRTAAVAELDSGLRAIVPGSPAESELVVRINETDPDLTMPPPESNHLLTAAE